jgi:hypothetical protein
MQDYIAVADYKARSLNAPDFWYLTISVRKIDYRFYNPEGMALL